MNHAMMPFNFGDSLIRSTVINGKPWFVAKDICNVLEHTNSRRAVAENCRPKGVTSRYTLTPGGKQNVTIIDQGNVLRLITRSRLPAAERFESWIFDEMLPELLSQGSYNLVDQAEKQRLEENKRITQHQEAAIRLMEKIRREHRPEIREAMHTAMVHNCQAGKMPAPPLEALGGPDLVERSRLDIFWNTVSELIAKGEEINHSHDPARLAVSLPHLQRLAEKHHLTLPKLSLLRRTLRGSETPLFIDYRTVNSGLFGGSVKCWVFAQEDDATQETGNGHF